MKRTFLFLLILSAGCGGGPVDKGGSPKYAQGSFGYDLDFLKQHDSVVVLWTPGGKQELIVSPRYQAKVFTSTANGEAGRSFGWINYKAFSGPEDAHMNAYGGENRLWLGPEGGRFSLFFARGDSMNFAHWHTPPPYDTEPWKVVIQDSQYVHFMQYMHLVNHSGTLLSIEIQRGIRILDDHAIDSSLQLSQDTMVQAVGYEVMNGIVNHNSEPWTETTGMPCIWMLDMFRPSPATVIIIPYKEGVGKIATTDYFGQILPDRIKYDKGVLFFKADGKSRGKLGLGPLRTRSVAGSYDATNKVLTIIRFDLDPGARYLNQEWDTVKPTFSGDAVNAYNDGPLADGSQMGPFYELESVSPAAILLPEHGLIHHHAVYHFTGDEAGLDKISRKVLNISLEEVKKAF